MRRLLLQGTAVVAGGASGLIAWAWPEARVAFITLGLAMTLGLAWLSRKVPPPGRPALLVVAAGTFVGLAALAVLLPSTRFLCDCPVPADAVRGFACACPIDHHLPLRAALAGTGTVIAGLLIVRSRRRPLASPVPGSVR